MKRLAHNIIVVKDMLTIFAAEHTRRCSFKVTWTVRHCCWTYRDPGHRGHERYDDGGLLSAEIGAYMSSGQVEHAGK